MKSEVLLAILKDLVSEIENTPTSNTDLGLSALIEEDEVQTLDDLFQELIEYARDEEEYGLVAALEGIYTLWNG